MWLKLWYMSDCVHIACAYYLLAPCDNQYHFLFIFLLLVDPSFKVDQGYPVGMADQDQGQV